jgi:hypothetical protein
MTEEKYRLSCLICLTAVFALLSSGMPASATETLTDESFAEPVKPHMFADRATELAMRAMGLVGIRYKYGGNSPENGMDCSSLVLLQRKVCSNGIAQQHHRLFNTKQNNRMEFVLIPINVPAIL